MFGLALQEPTQRKNTYWPLYVHRLNSERRNYGPRVADRSNNGADIKKAAM